MNEPKTLRIRADRRDIDLDIRTILYVYMKENVAEIHVSGGKVYRTRITMENLVEILGMDDYMKVHRSCLVAVMAIHSITEKIILNNGESLNYVLRRKKEILNEFMEKRERIVSSFQERTAQGTNDQYHERFKSFDDLPIAFADIEMVFDDKNDAVDWIFRYGNAALAALEQMPLDQIIGHSFGSIFPNMDQKWVRSYERTAVFGDVLTIIDYSPEIDAYLHVICFPTSKGHCGCLLFNVNDMTYAKNKGDGENARLHYIAKLLEAIV